MMASDETVGSKILAVDNIQDNPDLMLGVLEGVAWRVATVGAHV